MSRQYHGSCLCGKVKLTVPFTDTQFSACHCHTCRQWGAGPFMSLMYDGQIVVVGQENIGVYHSSQWAERAFCQACGTHLYYHLKGTQHYYLSTWIFEDINDLQFTTEVFIDKKPTCYAFANPTHKLTEADILAMAAANK